MSERHRFKQRAERRGTISDLNGPASPQITFG